MNVSSWLKDATRGDQVDRLDAELILSFCLGQERTFLHAHPELELSEEQQKQAGALLQRRRKHEPTAYILGRREFYGRVFELTPDVLIPRPETEDLVRVVKAYVESLPREEAIDIIDVGTGSGCIAATLACELPDPIIRITASDNSSKALECAQHNIKRLTKKSISTIKSDLLKSKELKSRKFDVIVANLPYVDKVWPWLDREALAYEPKTALYASDYGLALIKALILSAKNHLKPNGILVLESDISQHEDIIDFCEAEAPEFSPIAKNGQMQLNESYLDKSRQGVNPTGSLGLALVLYLNSR